ncbi:MAG: hypothetical protein OEU36_24875 [Gammaproteobacteria bacterium]|nr:hypothetical protein [Gammaproteobacteria bacterium]
MGRIGLLLTGLVAGLLVATAVVYWVVFPWVLGEAHSATSEIWRAEKQLKLANGATIPEGTEMTVDQYMPEGFVSLKLAINVEGESLESFSKRTERFPNLSIPYWVEP